MFRRWLFTYRFLRLHENSVWMAARKATSVAAGRGPVKLWGK